MFSFSVSNGCEFNQGNCILLAAEVLYLEPEASYPRIAAPAETLYKDQGAQLQSRIEEKFLWSR